VSHDALIDEVRAIRDAIAREHNYDLDSIFRMLRDREAKSREPHVTLPPKRPAGHTEPAGAAQGDAADGAARRS
jgi:hypothetical protein